MTQRILDRGERHHSTHGKRRWIALTALVVGAGLGVLEVWRAPIALLISVIGIGIATWLSRARRKPRRSDEPLFGRETQLGALLLFGLWIGVFVVFWLADSNVDSTLAAAIPIRFDGQSVVAGELLVHGLISTTASVLLLGSFDALRSRRRGRRTTTRPNAKP